MKKLLLLCSFFFLNFISAQPYLPMLENDHSWSVDVDWYYEPHGGRFSVDHNISGITMINGIEYKIVSSDEGIDCFMREENGLVYKYNDWADDEYVIYDFTLEIGDTWVYSEWYETLCSIGFDLVLSGAEFEVTNVTQEFIAGENRKVIELTYEPLNPQLIEYWYEGIGSSKGVDPGGESFHESVTLVCFTKNGVTTFFNGATSCDNPLIGFSDFNTSEIILAPNPVNAISMLQFPIELGIDQLRIYDITGRLVSEENINKNYTTINAMNYPSGIYFYQVYHNKSIVKTERFIIK